MIQKVETRLENFCVWSIAIRPSQLISEWLTIVFCIEIAHLGCAQVVSSKYFGSRKCCHPQISDLVIRLVFFRESSRKIINKLTSRLPSCESSIPGRFALFECNSNDVRICNKISQESCHQEIMKPKSDIWGWQHLWGPKDLLKLTPQNRTASKPSRLRSRTESFPASRPYV